MTRSRLAGAGLIGCAALLAACASEPAPRSLAQARQAVETAQEAGAFTAAPLEMRVARDKLDAAQAAAADKRNKDADRLAQEAIVNAELAQAKTQEAESRSALTNVQRSVEALRSQGGVAPAPSQPGYASPGYAQPAYPPPAATAPIR